MFKKIIKIPGKISFKELSISEIALMIEADSALGGGGNESFDSCALDEFLYCEDLSERPDLQKIRDHIAENIYLDVPGSKVKKINAMFLSRYALELRSESDGAL